jgi:folylpolyglutamate synthase/dihydropteroate synthase
LVEIYKKIMVNKNKTVKESRIFENINDSLDWLTKPNDNRHVNVLITGSLYVVGLALEVLNFNFS